MSAPSGQLSPEARRFARAFGYALQAFELENPAWARAMRRGRDDAARAHEAGQLPRGAAQRLVAELSEPTSTGAAAAATGEALPPPHLARGAGSTPARPTTTRKARRRRP